MMTTRVAQLVAVLVAVVGLAAAQGNGTCNAELCKYSDGGHGSCSEAGTTCLCDYGWTGESCLFPAASGQWGAWTFVAALFGVAVPWLVAVAAAAELLVFLRKHWGAVTRARVPAVATLAALAAGAALRTFYYAVDPFAWRATLNVCAMWGLDYVSTALVSGSFFLVLHGWAAVMGKFEQLNGRRAPLVLLWKWLPWYCVAASCLVLLLAAPGTVLSCVCTDDNCSSKSGDYVFYIPWLVLFGICLLLCVLAGGFMVLQLRRFGTNDSHLSTRVVRYTLFVLLSAIAGVFTLAFGIAVLSRSGNPSPSSFLAIEALNAVALDLLMVGVLLVSYQTTRKPPKRNAGIVVEGVSGPAGVSTLFAHRAREDDDSRSGLESGSDDSRSHLLPNDQ